MYSSYKNFTATRGYGGYGGYGRGGGGGGGGVGSYSSQMSGYPVAQSRFALLAKIIKFMSKRYKQGENHPLSIDDILEESSLTFVSLSTKKWLCESALKGNNRIELCNNGTCFKYKPPYQLKDGKSLMRLLKHHDLKSLGGIMLEDLQESLPNCDKILKSHENEIIFVTRPKDKKKVIFFNDKTAELQIDEEFKKHWRSVCLDHIDDTKVEEHLKREGVKVMQGSRTKINNNRKRATRKKRKVVNNKCNQHVAHILESYDESGKIEKTIDPNQNRK